jgi:hypothetical protein
LILLFGLINNHSFSHIPIGVIKINWITAPQYEFVHKLNPQKSVIACMDRYLQNKAARLTLHWCTISLKAAVLLWHQLTGPSEEEEPFIAAFH